ncbi:MAG: hypothetical protein CVU03_06825 [Bacteroidetes bacterium HGW-Bacteroidetes-2]|jgi:hypothetical protein|nr:MAG: hypothetical protein CVU03_06825 [Bacteroidetes bacterium HGW-Bacteroidetes-2]
MNSILDILNSDLGKQIVQGASAQTSASENKTNQVMSMAMPLLLAAMKKNASTPEGAKGLLNAIQTKHDGSLVNNLGTFFQGGVEDSALKDGAGILKHVLGGKQPQIENALSQKSGLDASSVAQILQIAAPIVLGMIGKQANEAKVNNQNGLANVLGGLLDGKKNTQQSFLESLLDANGDGSVVDDIAGMVFNGKSDKKQSGLGGLLGRFLKK